MDTRLKSSIIRVFNQHGGIVGAGFLISARHAITYAHVVAEALGCGANAERPDEEISFDVPLAAPDREVKANSPLLESDRFNLNSASKSHSSNVDKLSRLKQKK